MAHQVFISYGHQDKQVADATCARLEARGIRCWIAPRDVLPGQAYGEAINTAIRGCRALVLVFSSNANLSDHVSKEVERAVSNGIPVVPLRIENVTPTGALEYFIGSVHWLDALTQPIEAHLERLADSVERLLGAEPAKRPQPVPGPVPSPKPMGLYIALGALALAAAAGLLFTFGRGTVPEAPIAQGIAPKEAPSQPETDRTAPPTPPPAAKQPALKKNNEERSAASPPSSAPPAAEPGGIAGCWLYNNVRLRVEADGRITGSPMPGSWRAEGGNRYSMTWPSIVDTVQVSADGRSLAGTNNYGPAVSAQRVAPGAAGSRSLAGTWQWNNGATVLASDNGAIATGPVQGRWLSQGGGTYRIDWGLIPVDQLDLSPDGRTLSGQNNFGAKVGGTRCAP